MTKKSKESVGIANQYEPLRTSRFEVEFPEGSGLEPFTVQSINKPSYRYGSWNHTEIVFLDYIGPSSSRSLYSILQKEKPLKSLSIKSLDPTGVVVETWNVTLEEILEIDFGFCKREDELSPLSNLCDLLSTEDKKQSKVRVVIRTSDCKLS